MQNKLFFLLGLLCLPLAGHAQDFIYKRNGDVIKAVVKEVNVKSISYKRFDNPDGPTYTINKMDVEQITYQNGTADKFDGSGEAEIDAHNGKTTTHRKPKVVYGNNILAIAPVGLFADVSQSGYCVGASYEHTFGKKGIIGLYIPVYAGFSFNYDPAYSTSGNTYNYEGGNYTSFSVTPGIKFYPGGSKGTVRYAIGPALFFTTGTLPATSVQYDQNGYPQYVTTNSSYTIFGFMIVNSLNVSPTPHLFMGLDLGMGCPFYDNRPGTDNNTLDDLIVPSIRFAFNIGYRF